MSRHNKWNARTFNASDVAALVTIWNAACGSDLRITERSVIFNTQPPLGVVQAGQVALENDEPVGFILASALPNDPLTSPPEIGWIDALAVSPTSQHQGLGSELLAWAEEWLRRQGCTAVRLGGSPRPFVPGYPVELDNVGFFSRRAFQDRENGAIVWDVARDLDGYEPARAPVYDVIRPAEYGDEEALLHFFEREFPNRWRYEYQEFLRMNGRISDWIILLTRRGVDGFVRLTFEESVQPIERFYPYRLARPWGQLGPIGVSQDMRGQGYGRRLLEAGLSILRDRGVRGVVIDWTDQVGFYAKFGFSPYRQYAMLIKKLQ